MSDQGKRIVKMHVCHQFVEQFQICAKDNFTVEGVAKEKCGTPTIEVEAEVALRWCRIMDAYAVVQKEIEEAAAQLYTPVVPTVLGSRTWEQSCLPPEFVAKATQAHIDEPVLHDPDSPLTIVEGEVPRTPTPEVAQRALLAEEAAPLEGGLKRSAFRTVMPAGS